MASVKWEAGSLTTAMSTDLNSLSDDANNIGSSIDNSTDLFVFDDYEWHQAALGYTPSTGAVIELYLLSSIDGGTTYGEGSDTIDPPASSLIGVFNIRATTAAQTHILRQVYIPAGQFKLLVINKTGGSLASSGNTLKRRPYRFQT